MHTLNIYCFYQVGIDYIPIEIFALNDLSGNDFYIKPDIGTLVII